MDATIEQVTIYGARDTARQWPMTRYVVRLGDGYVARRDGQPVAATREAAEEHYTPVTAAEMVARLASMVRLPTPEEIAAYAREHGARETEWQGSGVVAHMVGAGRD